MQKIYRPLSRSVEQPIEYRQLKRTLQKATITDRIDNLLFEHQDDPSTTFLLDEKYFDLVRYPISGEVYEPLSLAQLNNLVAQKLDQATKEHAITGKLLLYDVDHISVNGKSSQYLLGQTGKLERDVFLIFLRPALALNLPHLGTKRALPHIYPSSYFTMQFVTKQLHKDSFMMISLYDHSVRLIIVRDGFYHDIQTLDRGINNLKQILIANNVISYLDKSNEEIAKNSLASSILWENIDFYLTMIFDRLIEHNDAVTTSVVSIPEFANSLLYDQFVKHYQHRIGWYILPNSAARSLEQYNRVRKSNELDVLTYLNYAEKKELIH